MRTTLFFLATAWLLPFLSNAQNSGFMCGANELHRMGDIISGHPERLQQIEQYRSELEHFTQAWQADATRDQDDNTYIIPVVFHIVHNNGAENISDAQVLDGLRVMNEDFNKLTPDWDQVQPEFLDRVADMEVTFKMAQLDPDGNCTNGITRTVSTLTYEGNQEMKDLVRWPRDRYLNIWVASAAGGAAGYSMYPSSVAGPWGEDSDGIVVMSSYVGAIGTSDENKSHTLSHEAGHWMNLKHCWGDSNEPGLESNCNMDDNVSDTPNTKGWQSCNLQGATCGSPKDNVENFMEYSYCSKMFTTGQKNRVHAALNSGTASRNNLWSASNLALTGVNNEPEICAVAFTSTMRTICAGGSVTFTDASYNGVTEWNWNFNGGSPSTANTANPTVTYDTPGVYDVSLTVGNGIDDLGAVEQQYITVLPMTGDALPIAESFEEGTTFTPTIWTAAEVASGTNFEVSSTTAFTGSNSVKLSNSSSTNGRTFELVSSTVDITGDPPAVLSFRYAFAKRLNSNEDALRVFASRDCGATWSLRRALVGDDLATAPNTGGSFVPNGPGQWGYNETSPIGGLYEVSNLRFKFVFESNGGNNLWLDDINVNGASVGISELGSTAGQALYVVPNPAKDRAEVSTFLAEAGRVKVELVDLLGRPLKVIAEGVAPAGEARWTMDLGELPAGMYFVRVQQAAGNRVAKFTKE
ncbi:MAG: T9SS type A sorting domain-containing protein [Flavobacteriales bacterium]|nr:T9SS type A sorting domain-containing protein [Flavobacteriales bacterium]